MEPLAGVSHADAPATKSSGEAGGETTAPPADATPTAGQVGGKTTLCWSSPPPDLDDELIVVSPAPGPAPPAASDSSLVKIYSPSKAPTNPHTGLAGKTVIGGSAHPTSPDAMDEDAARASDDGTEADDDDDDGDDDGQGFEGDIREELEDILESDLNFQGSFAFARTYDDAPNPALALADIGTVGLPLSCREAQVLKAQCAQAPFGKGERTVVDTDVRDTWEMDAAKVHFDNPSWAVFMARVVRDVCQTLGVNVEASQPRCELYKLLLYETGSHFLAHVDTEKSTGMFASIIVVLPSFFTGGDAHLSHAEQTITFNSSGASRAHTTVLSWYTDVMHEIKPITSGFRLALSYNLVHTTTSIRPALSLATSALTRLRRVLLAWRDDDDAPEQITYLLEHKYAQAGLSASALKGSDAHASAILDELARALGFSLGLGNLVHTLTGRGVDSGGGYGRGWGRGRHRDCGCGTSDEEDEDEDADMDMDDDEMERSTNISNLVDLDGKLICANMSLSEDDDTIPRDLVESLESGDYDDQQYEGYQGNFAGSVDRFYRRTVLVIWPSTCHIGNGGGDRRAVFALDKLAACEQPTADDEELFEYVLESQSLPRAKACETLCATARRWRRPDLWQTTLLVFGNGNSPDEMFAAVASFGFDAVKDGLVKSLQRIASNLKRIQFLSSLLAWTVGQGSAPLEQAVAAFEAEQKLWVLTNLKPPAKEEMHMLTDVAIAHGGITFLEETIVPQVKATSKPELLEEYATFLHGGRQRFAATPDAEAVLQRILAGLLSDVLDKTDFYQTKTTATHGYAYYGAHQNPTPQPALAFIKKCLDCGADAVAARAVERVADAAGQDAGVAGTRATCVLLPLLSLLSDELKRRSHSLSLDKLSDAAIRLTLEAIAAKKVVLTKDSIDGILRALALSNKMELLASTVLPKFKGLPWNETQWRLLIDQLSVRTDPTLLGYTSSLDAALADILATFARRVPLPASSGAAYSDASARQIGSLLDFCAKKGGLGPMKIVLDRVVAPNLLTADYLSRILVPLVPHLSTSAATLRVPLSSEPFASALRTIVRSWVRTILGPKPDDSRTQSLLANLAQLTCPCHPCVTVQRFLTREPGVEMTLQRIGAPKRTHVESNLTRYGRGAATFSTVRTTPQGLKVLKSVVLSRPSKWKADQEIGLRMLKTLGNDALLRAILGDEYPMIVTAMNGIATPPSAAASSAAPPPPASHGVPQHAQAIPPRAASTAVRPGGTSATATHAAAFAPIPGRGSGHHTVSIPGTSAQARTAGSQGSASRTGVRPGPAAPVTPAKRKSDVVIDLCTP